jgi:hypothetical protein
VRVGTYPSRLQLTEEVRRTAEIMLGQGGLESAAIFGYARSRHPCSLDEQCHEGRHHLFAASGPSLRHRAVARCGLRCPVPSETAGSSSGAPVGVMLARPAVFNSDIRKKGLAAFSHSFEAACLRGAVSMHPCPNDVLRDFDGRIVDDPGVVGMGSRVCH